MPFFPAGTYDLFLTHGWRYTDEWQSLVALLDGHFQQRWRNWSLPWYDTSIEWLSREGHAQLAQTLCGQIEWSSAILVVPETIASSEGRLWLDIELNIARDLGKPVVGVARMDGRPFPQELVDRVDVVVPRDAVVIARAVDGLLRPQAMTA